MIPFSFLLVLAVLVQTPLAHVKGKSPANETERFTRQVAELTNAERKREGLPPLREEPRLNAAAMAHARDMLKRRYFAHEDPEGKEPWDRVKAQGYEYRACAENIAKGAQTPERVVAMWMKSPGHRRNILGDCVDLGVGFARGGKKGRDTYWVQVFGTERANDER